MFGFMAALNLYSKFGDSSWLINSIKLILKVLFYIKSTFVQLVAIDYVVYMKGEYSKNEPTVKECKI